MGNIECVCTPDDRESTSYKSQYPVDQSFKSWGDLNINKSKESPKKQKSELAFILKKQQDLNIHMLSCRQIEQVFWQEIILLENSSTLRQACISEYSLMSCLEELQLIKKNSQELEAMMVMDHFYRKLKVKNSKSGNYSLEFSQGIC